MKFRIKHRRITLKKRKNIYIIEGSVRCSGNWKLLQDGYQKKEDAEQHLIDMGCVYESPFWEKDNMIYSITKIHVH